MTATLVVPVEAYAIAATVSIKGFADAVGPANRLRATKTELVLKYGETSWAVVHDFGVLVLFGVPNETRDRLLTALRRFDENQTTDARPPLAESFGVEVSAGEHRVAFDRIFVPRLDERTAEILAFVIGQSLAMEYYEEDVDRLLERLGSYAEKLAAAGRFQGSQRELLRFIGRGMGLRNRVIHTLALLDSPALAWDDEALDRLHRELRGSFAIDDRFRALDHKLTTIGQNLELLVDLVRHRRGMLLELSVLVLIAIEVILFVYQLRQHA